MTQTPGQAVHAEMKRQGEGYWKARLWDHDAIADAAIEAAGELVAAGLVEHVRERSEADTSAQAVIDARESELGTLGEVMEKFWHDLAGQGDFYNRDGRTDKGDAYRQIAHDLSAALKKHLPPPAPTEDEREHCERLANEHRELGPTLPRNTLRDLLIRERAAARAQGDVQGYERGRAGVGEDDIFYMQCANATLDRTRRELDKLQCSYERLAGVVRFVLDDIEKVRDVLRDAYKPGDDEWTLSWGLELALDALRAALGPAPAPEEKL